jgi:hypothetical protein
MSLAFQNIRRPRWLPRRRVVWTPALPADTARPAPDLALSVIVICYKMEGQIGNTLKSLSMPYQRGIDAKNYEILLVDNGSPQPLAQDTRSIAENIHYEYVPPDKAAGNPGIARNRAVARARGETVCLMIDGARMVTPGVLNWGLQLTRVSPTALVEVRGWHLGHKMQMESVLEGYTSETEREMLDGIDWTHNGYRLFEIGTPAQSTASAFYGKATETTCAFMSRAMYQSIGGYDERYAEPGGGLANFDFFYRATTSADIVFTLLGEGTFHQIHGGASTGLSAEMRRATFRRWRGEYERLSRRFINSPPPYEPVLAGHVPDECRRWLKVGT